MSLARLPPSPLTPNHHVLISHMRQQQPEQVIRRRPRQVLPFKFAITLQSSINDINMFAAAIKVATEEAEEPRDPLITAWGAVFPG